MATDITEARIADRDNAILELERRGLSRRTIARELGIGKSTVDHVINTHKLTQAVTQQTAQVVPLEHIVENPWQPRATRTIEEEMLTPEVAELADNIKELGLLQFPVGRKIRSDRYELAFGHRRVAAIRLLAARGDWTGGVPLVVQDLSNRDMTLTALAENQRRKQLNPMEEVRAYQRVLDEVEDLSIAELARSIGVDRSTLSNNLRVLKLPQVVLEQVESAGMPLRSAREFLCLQNDDHCHQGDMRRAITRIVNAGETPDWSVKNVRREIRRLATLFPQEWRPLEAAYGDINYLAYEPNNGLEPRFDIKEITDAEPYNVHHLPRLVDEKSRSWTCNVKKWQQLEQAASNPVPIGIGTPQPIEPQPPVSWLNEDPLNELFTLNTTTGYAIVVHAALMYSLKSPHLSTESREIILEIADELERVFQELGVEVVEFTVGSKANESA